MYTPHGVLRPVLRWSLDLPPSAGARHRGGSASPEVIFTSRKVVSMSAAPPAIPLPRHENAAESLPGRLWTARAALEALAPCVQYGFLSVFTVSVT